MKSHFNRSHLLITILIVAAFSAGQNNALATETAIIDAPAQGADVKKTSNGKYADINGLRMYYEIHGSGHPLVLLHGAFGFVESWGPLLTALAKNHQVIALELQGHGHTNDLDRALSFEQMADDTAALLNHLKVTKADIFGYSLGGTVALAISIRRPELVRKLAIYGSCAGNMKDTYDPGTYKQFQSLSTDFAPAPLKEPYDRMAPDPKRWPILVTKIKNLEKDFKGFSADEVKTIKAQTLIMMGDRDAVRPEHAVEMYRLIPNSQLAIFPGSDHFLVYTGPDRLLSTLLPFLDTAVTDPRKA